MRGAGRTRRHRRTRRARRGGGGVAVGGRRGRRRSRRRRLGVQRGLGRALLGLGTLARFLLGLALALDFLGARAVLLGELLLFGQIALLGFLQLAQDLGALVVHPSARGRRRTLGGQVLGRLHVGALLPDLDVDRGLAAPGADRHFLQLAPVQGDLLRRRLGLFLDRLVGLAVSTAQEAQQLHLFGAGDDLVGTAELHPGVGQLNQQFLDRRVHQFGQLADGGLLRHSDPMIWLAPPRRVRR
ncbi:hypothetical protein NB697_003793 [Xanthomonas sacchari]|nr:hypothetical protein [Xanthomonas sacchari]